MQIKVKSLQGDEYIVEIQNDQTVSQLKISISEKANGLAPERQKLVSKGRTMQDSSLLGEYNLEEGSKVHLILQKENVPCSAPSSTTATEKSTTTSAPSASSSSSSHENATNRLQNDPASRANTTDDPSRRQSRFEIILRERLAEHFAPNVVKKIMDNLQDEINADIHSSSLDDLERLAKQKLNISNE